LELRGRLLEPLPKLLVGDEPGHDGSVH
jgi:hypothetical protein